MTWYQPGGSVSQTRRTAAPSQTPISLMVLAAVLLPALLAYALATMNENRVLAMALAAVGALIVLARPFWGLIFFAALLYTRPEESIAAIQGMRLPLLISLLTLFALVIQKLLTREPAVKTPMNGMIVGFGAAVVASTLSYGNTSEAAQEIAKLVVLALLVVNLVNTPARYQTFVTALLLFTSYLAAYSLYLYFTGGALIQHDILRSQATGIFGDPNDLSTTIVSGLALGLTRARKKGLPRVFYAGLAVLMIWAILLTNSRGGMLAMLVVVGGFFWAFIRIKSVAMLLAVLSVGAFLALGPSRMTSFDSAEESANSRFWFWTNAVDLLKQSPVLGVGYGQFTDLNDGMTAHNTFVLCFAETGLVGYFFWMGCLYYCYKPGPRSQKVRKESSAAFPDEDIATATAREELLGARLALTGFLAGVFWLSRTYIPVLYLLLALPVAQQIAYSHSPFGSSLDGPERWRDWGRIGLIAVGSIVFIYVFALRMR